MTIPKQKRAQIVEALQANPNASAVAKQVGGVVHKTVWRIAKAAGIELSRPPLPPEKRAGIVAALEANQNASAVAKQVGGVHHTTVCKIAKDAGIELAGRGRRPL